MFVKLSIENFRSIKERQELDFSVTNPKGHLSDNVIFSPDDKIGVVRTAGIYGPNASGKSNVLRAFRALLFVACVSGDLKDGQTLKCYEPYLLSDETSRAPVKFIFEFINSDAIRYRYTIAYTESEIVEEALEFFPSRSKATLFRRNQGDTWEDIHFGNLYKGRSRKIPLFKNNSYLAKAGSSADASEVMRSVYNYFINNIVEYSQLDEAFGPNYDDDDLLGLAAKFLCNVDTGISAIEKKERDASAMQANIFPPSMPDSFKERILQQQKRDFLFSHKKDDGTFAQFKRTAESMGTQKLFIIIPLLFRTFSEGATLLIDEIDASFHPHVAELIIKLFNDPETNTNNAQLIFTTHSLSLMSSKLLRRDQVWFVQKSEGATALFSLNEYDKSMVKPTSPFAEWYDEGRFGALPSVNYGILSELIRSINDSVKTASSVELGESNGEG